MKVGDRVYIRSTTRAEFHAGTVTALGAFGRFRVTFDTRYRWITRVDKNEEVARYTFTKPDGRDSNCTKIRRQRVWYPASSAAFFKRGNPLQDDGKPTTTGARLHV